MGKNKSGFLLGAVFGAAVAGVSALLFAPKSGEELRDDLRAEMDDLLERANEYKDYAVERGTEFYETANEKTEDIKVNLKYSADNLRSQFEDVTHEAGNEFNKLKAEVARSKDKLAAKSGEFVETAKNEAGAFGEVVKEEVSDLASHANDEGNLTVQTYFEKDENAEELTENLYGDAEKIKETFEVDMDENA